MTVDCGAGRIRVARAKGWLGSGTAARALALVAIVPLALTAGCSRTIATGLGVEEIGPAEVGTLLESGRPVVVVDMRPAAAYEQGHVPGAVWLGSDGGIPASVDGNATVVVVCESGHLSPFQAAAFQARTRARVTSLAGGMRAWRENGLAVARGVAAEPLLLASEPGPPRQAGPLEAAAVALTAYGVKPAYMVLSLVLIVVLWRSHDRDLKLLRWALAGFLVGEAFCAVDYLGTGGVSVPLEALHGAGMLVMGALLPWAAFELVDTRFMRFSDPAGGCAAGRLCRSCWKHTAAACPVHRLFLVAAPSLAALSLMPWTAPLVPLSEVREVWGAAVRYEVGPTLQLLQFRLYPLTACMLFVVAFLFLLRGRRGLAPARLPFFAAFGFASFALFRFVLLAAYRSAPGWKDVWEELTELAVVVAVAVLLHALREQLGLQPGTGRAANDLVARGGRVGG